LDAETIRRSGVRGNPDVSALASLDKNKLAVLVWHYHDDDVPGPDCGGGSWRWTICRSPTAWRQLTQYRIDSDHSNSYEAWKRMGSPMQPTPEQYAQLEKAGKLAELGTPQKIKVENGKADVNLKLPRQAVTLLVLE
jgi:xylan 1,4-beta-xylosidase